MYWYPAQGTTSGIHGYSDDYKNALGLVKMKYLGKLDTSNHVYLLPIFTSPCLGDGSLCYLP